MDEPLSHLDELTARALRHDLAALCYTGSYTVLFVTHNAAEASYLADQVVVLSNKPTCVRAEMRLDTSRPRDFEGYATLRAQRELLRLLGVTGGEPDVPKNSQMV
jgi:ABC-type nitrate/sulfonate/bicarbonate transport system ATPase subunit